MCRVALMILLCFCCAGLVKGQQITYGYIDSLSYAQYIAGDWDNLIETADIAKKADINFPLLSMRIGYAALMKGNNSLSLKHYSNALEFDSFNQDALYYAVLNNTLLGRRDAASYISLNLNDAIKKPLNVGYKKWVELIDVESSIKATNNDTRKTGQYYRFGIGNRINYRWKLYHSLITYRQNLLAQNNNDVNGGPPRRNQPITFRSFLVNDYQYYLKSEIFLNSKLSLTNAFHYTYTYFDNSTYTSCIFNAGLKITLPYVDYKLELNVGPMLDSLLTQVAFSSTYYPFGNLNFYGNSRLSFQNRTNLSQLNYAQMFGFKLNKKVWLETHATFGQIKNLIDNEALYIYDALDVGKYRIGATLLIPFSSKFTLLTNYYYEQKQLYIQNTKYNLNSFTIGISWKL
jgi:hypothetical protein